MEQRGIATDKGNLNREIAAQNKLLKEMKARITRLYNWSKEQGKQPETLSISRHYKNPTVESCWMMVLPALALLDKLSL